MREPSPGRTRPWPPFAAERGSRPQVALFRAREDANATAARLRRFGFSVASLPVIEIRPSPVEPRRLRYDAVIATSDKAFLSAPRLDKRPALYVVGARTGRAAEARGWRLASPPAREAAELIATLIGALQPKASVLYLAGRDRKEAVESALAKNFELEVVETYAAEAREAWRPSEARALASCVAALHYSRRSAALAAALAKRAGAETCFLKLKHVCLSRDVAEPLQKLGATSIALAETPDEAGLFHMLREALGGFPSLGSSRI
ncbi:MAG: uroporphyrinogen-III synthase [Hyphomicrobiales bacterium]|nr:uroporphyrinogen-III synthase [Hyphomicrobiales bacterium]